MKININIEDATPEELTRLFGGLQTEQVQQVNLAGANHKGRIQNLNNPPWTDEERDTITGCKNGQEAVKVHREKYPASSRTTAAIKRQLLVIQKIPEPIPKIEVKQSVKAIALSNELKEAPPSPKKEAKPMVEKSARVNKYGIPSSLATTDKKTYQRLWYRCKVQGIMYEEALKQEGVMKRGKRPGKPTVPKTPPEKKPRKSPVKKERLPFHQTQTGGAASSDVNSPVITSGIPTTPTIYQSNTSSHGLQLKAGDKVRHNGSKASPHFGKDGEILKVEENGQVFVKFGETSTWLSPHLVAVVQGVGA